MSMLTPMGVLNIFCLHVDYFKSLKCKMCKMYFNWMAGLNCYRFLSAVYLTTLSAD
jgi:hypothetical protein